MAGKVSDDGGAVVLLSLFVFLNGKLHGLKY